MTWVVPCGVEPLQLPIAACNLWRQRKHLWQGGSIAKTTVSEFCAASGSGLDKVDPWRKKDDSQYSSNTNFVRSSHRFLLAEVRFASQGWRVCFCLCA